MSKLKRLDTQEQFNDLKKGQEIVVLWKEGSDEHRRGNKVGKYKMVKVSDSNELILKVQGNVYFNITMYLNGESSAEDAGIVVPEIDIVREENECLRRALKDAQERFDLIYLNCDEIVEVCNIAGAGMKSIDDLLHSLQEKGDTGDDTTLF